MARKKKTTTKTTQAEVMQDMTLTNETIEVKATQVEEIGMSLQAHDFFNHLSEEIDQAAESGNIEALENLNYYARLLWLKAEQAENKAKASKVEQVEPEPQPVKPEPVKPAPVDQSKVNQAKKELAQKRLDEILRAFPEYRMFLPRPLRLEGALKFIEDYGHLVPESEPVKLHPNQAPAKAGKVKKAEVTEPEYIGKVEKSSKSGVAYAYRDLQKILKEARNAGKEVNCRLNGKRETLQAEAVRLGLL